MVNDTYLEYIKRINNVLYFIEDNLDGDLSLKTLSQIAAFSQFHFHRIFSTIVGESLNDYIVRKRVERIASILLVGTDEKLTNIAYKYGFNSVNTFSKTFKKLYGISPTEFNKNKPEIFSKIGIKLVTDEKYFCIANHLKKWIDMNAKVEIKELPEMKLAGITTFGNFELTNKNYLKLFKWADENKLIEGREVKVVTIYYDNPHVTTTMEKVRHAECISIDTEIRAVGDIVPIINPKGKYAVGRFEIRPGDEFQKAWEGMYSTVIEKNYKFRDGGYMEIFHNDCRNHPEKKFIVDICIPIE
ncbi:MAG: AraC family transcriptional regulator [Prevotella sp.]|jgi:DNA gyrase inhibitor GyrI/AraC-like DNA-binding protein|nr:AraC family transcriptional regulator [Prevotella sp.]